MAKKRKQKKAVKHPSIVNEQVVLSMAVLLLLMAGMLAGIMGQQQTFTQTQAAQSFPTSN